MQLSTNSKINSYDKVYCALLYFLGLSLAFSPAGRAFAGINNYDRFCDALTVLALTIRIFEILQKGAKPRLNLSFYFLIFYIVIAVSISLLSKNFFSELLFTELKILVFIFLTQLFNDRTLDYRARRKLTSFFLLSFVVGLVLHTGLTSHIRLMLWNESNYTMFVGFFVVIAYAKIHEVAPFSLMWIFLLSILLAAALLADSRTGFAAVGFYILYSAYKSKSPFWYASIGLACSIVALWSSQFLELVTRGASDGSKIDRLVFLNEYLKQISDAGWFKFLFSWNVGIPISYDVYQMGWWVKKQSLQHNLDPMLAPYNFHSGILRLLSAYGFVFTVVFYIYLYNIFSKKHPLALWLLVIASVSMSVFYLSSVMPAILLLLLAGKSEPAEAFTSRQIYYQKDGVRV